MSKLPKKQKTSKLPDVHLTLMQKDDVPKIMAVIFDEKYLAVRRMNNVTLEALATVRDYLLQTMPEGEVMNGVQYEIGNKIFKLFVCVQDAAENVSDDKVEVKTEYAEENQDDNRGTDVQN